MSNNKLKINHNNRYKKLKITWILTVKQINNYLNK
jgi:hypothetical protein